MTVINLLILFCMLYNCSHSFSISKVVIQQSRNRCQNIDNDYNNNDNVNVGDVSVADVDTIDKANTVVWTAAVKSSVKVKEDRRSTEEYLALPASQYSVLSADQVERLSDSSFRCSLGSLNFFGTKVCPILFVDVNVFPEQARRERRQSGVTLRFKSMAHSASQQSTRSARVATTRAVNF